jgi:hypothetical protein
MRRLLVAVSLAATLIGVVGSGSASGKHNPPGSPTTSIFASGFNNPRGLTFGPDGNLYVAEGGLGGSHSTVGQCPQAHGAAAPYTGSSHDPVLGGRISKISPARVVSTVVNALPSSQTSPALNSLVSGVSSVAFIGHKLYGLLAGAGCSHGVPDVPNGVFRVGSGGSWSMIANLSAFQSAHPVANPDNDDFEPDGTWYSMIAVDGALYPADSNHQELDRVTTSGHITRLVDISAQFPNWIGPEDGSVPNEHVYKLSSSGNLVVHASGLEQVLGLAFRNGKLYALEMSTTPGGPTPGSGAIVRVRNGAPAETVASGLMFPTGMTVGPDGAFYVSENGFGFPAGAGRVLRITAH